MQEAVEEARGTGAVVWSTAWALGLRGTVIGRRDKPLPRSGRAGMRTRAIYRQRPGEAGPGLLLLTHAAHQTHSAGHVHVFSASKPVRV